jgi:hypothetical protein
MMRHPVALYLQATAPSHDGHFELFDRRERRSSERQLFGFIRRFVRPAAAERVRRETLAPSSPTA